MIFSWVEEKGVELKLTYWELLVAVVISDVLVKFLIITNYINSYITVTKQNSRKDDDATKMCNNMSTFVTM